MHTRGRAYVWSSRGTLSLITEYIEWEEDFWYALRNYKITFHTFENKNSA